MVKWGVIEESCWSAKRIISTIPLSERIDALRTLKDDVESVKAHQRGLERIGLSAVHINSGKRGFTAIQNARICCINAFS